MNVISAKEKLFIGAEKCSVLYFEGLSVVLQVREEQQSQEQNHQHHQIPDCSGLEECLPGIL